MGRNISLIMAMLCSIVMNAQVSFSVTTPMEDNGDWLVQIIMDNGTTKVSGFQCDLTIPAAFSYTKGEYSFTSRCQEMKQGKYMETHSLTGEGITNGGTTRLDIFSNDLDEIQNIKGGDGAVVTLRLSGLSTATPTPCNLTNIVVVTLDEDGFPNVEGEYPKAVIGDSTLACYDVMGSDILVIGNLTESQQKEMNNCIRTAPVINSVDLSLCTNASLGTLPLPSGSDPELLLANKTQVTNKTSRTFYRRNGQWAVDRIDLLDADVSYVLDRDLLVDNASYTRNFKNTSWQAWYMPFEVSVASMAGDYEFAEFVNVTEDEECIFIHTNIITEGNIKANTPYIVKANATGSRKLAWEDIKARKTVAGSQSFTTPYSSFVFTGTYSQKADMYANGSYALSGGELARASSASVKLGAFRWFMDFSTMSAKVKKCVILFDDLANGIITMRQESEDAAKVYDLNGRPVSVMGKGVYILNGKKLMK